MLEQRKQRRRFDASERRLGSKSCEDTCTRISEAVAAGIVDRNIPALQRGGDATRESAVGRDQRGGLAFRLGGLAQGRRNRQRFFFGGRSLDHRQRGAGSVRIGLERQIGRASCRERV